VLSQLADQLSRSAAVKRKAIWAIGDALAYAENRRYGETCKLAAEATGLPVDYLYDLASAARTAAPEQRRATSAGATTAPWRTAAREAGAHAGAGGRREVNLRRAAR
jgi:hypothetical protein